ncbi:hypothetical protein [Persicitalea jodogahamensis]|uniref:Uncharacterized protein n=1 Tax=Persicitalea jodogahamensis TaxID=402147 RepID=A0A8J3G7P6_9BACT|nr:hypothetical protein [Persicitalea jodogahamensis]GHB57522.1 hypothetical protein GCM10007390_08680 [Persicitalea jodogahamensis]
MTLTQVYRKKTSLSEIRSSIRASLIAKINANQEVFASLTRTGDQYGGNVFANRNYQTGSQFLTREPAPLIPFREEVEEPDKLYYKNRYSVLYLLKDQYQHIGCSTREEAQATIKTLFNDQDRFVVGVYDDRTELFEWDAALRDEYEKASMKDQGRSGEQIIRIAQALRRRDSSWDSADFNRPSFFA